MERDYDEPRSSRWSRNDDDRRGSKEIARRTGGMRGWSEDEGNRKPSRCYVSRKDRTGSDREREGDNRRDGARNGRDSRRSRRDDEEKDVPMIRSSRSSSRSSYSSESRSRERNEESAGGYPGRRGSKNLDEDHERSERKSRESNKSNSKSNKDNIFRGDKRSRDTFNSNDQRDDESAMEESDASRSPERRIPPVMKKPRHDESDKSVSAQITEALTTAYEGNSPEAILRVFEQHQSLFTTKDLISAIYRIAALSEHQDESAEWRSSNTLQKLKDALSGSSVRLNKLDDRAFTRFCYSFGMLDPSNVRAAKLCEIACQEGRLEKYSNKDLMKLASIIAGGRRQNEAEKFCEEIIARAAAGDEKEAFAIEPAELHIVVCKICSFLSNRNPELKKKLVAHLGPSLCQDLDDFQPSGVAEIAHQLHVDNSGTKEIFTAIARFALSQIKEFDCSSLARLVSIYFGKCANTLAKKTPGVAVLKNKIMHRINGDLEDLKCAELCDILYYLELAGLADGKVADACLFEFKNEYHELPPEVNVRVLWALAKHRKLTEIFCVQVAHTIDKKYQTLLPADCLRAFWVFSLFQIGHEADESKRRQGMFEHSKTLQKFLNAFLGAAQGVDNLDINPTDASEAGVRHTIPNQFNYSRIS